MTKDFYPARFKYIRWQALYEREKPFEILIDIPDASSDRRRSNIIFETSSSPQMIESNWADRAAVEHEYIPEMERLVLEKVEGADRVFTYDWRLRNSASIFPPVMNLKDPTEALHPATQPHVDCSQDGCITMLKHHLPHEAQDLMKKRYRIINVWRPLKKVQNWPLAVCDGRSVDQRDLVAADRVRREFVGEGLWSLENAKNRWYYWPDQQADELILLKIADSCDEVITKNCVHASFSLGHNVEHIARESIELRMFIFTD